MKEYACVHCGHRWFEPLDNEKKPGWGCPNGCAAQGVEVSNGHHNFIQTIFERWLEKTDDDSQKEKIRHHLKLLKGHENYP
ncbi:hypothetical protein GOV08_04265 [Candidatus Woesearchaeota archaeon]|nr:hypothetical protein [Candidatus Woesearchaeota archaeon]